MNVNFTNANRMGNSITDIQDEVVGPEDMSSIYPLDQNECYFNYSPKNSNPNTVQNSCRMNSNLNDLLECLNKSEH